MNLNNKRNCFFLLDEFVKRFRFWVEAGPADKDYAILELTRINGELGRLAMEECKTNSLGSESMLSLSEELSNFINLLIKSDDADRI